MADAKVCHGLTTYFVKKFGEKYQADPIVNRNKARWFFDSMLMDYSVGEIRELIDYYFLTDDGRKHSIDIFAYNYDQLIESSRTHKKEQQRLAAMRAASAERAQRWKERGKQVIDG